MYYLKIYLKQPWLSTDKQLSKFGKYEKTKYYGDNEKDAETEE